jgi:hypothetical protein
LLFLQIRLPVQFSGNSVLDAITEQYFGDYLAHSVQPCVILEIPLDYNCPHFVANRSGQLGYDAIEFCFFADGAWCICFCEVPFEGLRALDRVEFFGRHVRHGHRSSMPLQQPSCMNEYQALQELMP